jgi:hypothetical protein
LFAEQALQLVNFKIRSQQLVNTSIFRVELMVQAQLGEHFPLGVAISIDWAVEQYATLCSKRATSITTARLLALVDPQLKT